MKTVCAVTEEPPTPAPEGHPAARDRAGSPDNGLRARSVRGGVVTVASQGVLFVLQLGSTMALARLLNPSDFGLIAMVTAVTGFVAIFKDAGLSHATVQQHGVTEQQVSTLFWLNLALAVSVMGVVVLMAPLIAWFYDEPRLTGITLVLATAFVFSGLAVQHLALLRRHLRFTTVALIDIASAIVGSVTAVLMALGQWGVWALAWLPVVTAASHCFFVWGATRWWPRPPKWDASVAAMVRFGGGLTAFNLLNYFTRNADNVMVGALLGSGPLGIYSKAYSLLMMPIRQINQPMTTVLVPTLSRLRDDPDRYTRAFLQAIGSLAFLGMPLVAFLTVIADEIVGVVLGDGWSDAASTFRWLAPAALAGTINVAPGWLCHSLGRSDVLVRWALLSAPLSVLAFWVGASWGVTGVAAAFSGTWCVLLVLCIRMACRVSPVPFASVIHAAAQPLWASVTAAVVTALVLSRLGVSDLAVTLVIKGVTFAGVYCGCIALLSTGRARLHQLLLDGRAVFTRANHGDARAAVRP